MRPLRKSFTNWVFSAFSCTSLVPAASISDRSSGLEGGGEEQFTNEVFNQSFMKLLILPSTHRSVSSFSTDTGCEPLATLPGVSIFSAISGVFFSAGWSNLSFNKNVKKFWDEKKINEICRSLHLDTSAKIRLKCKQLRLSSYICCFRKTCTLSRIAGFIFPIVVSQLTQLEQQAATQCQFIEFAMVPEICITAGATQDKKHKTSINRLDTAAECWPNMFIRVTKLLAQSALCQGYSSI